MNRFTTTAVLALVTASLGLGAAAPLLAQDAATPAAQTQGDNQPAAERGFRNAPGMHQRGMGGGFLNVERGAEAIEIAVVRLSHAIDLTEEQMALLDTLKTDALAAASTFEATTVGLRPTIAAVGETVTAPGMSERFANRIAMETARLAALQSIQPAYTAFFDSLTDEQLAQLLPERGERPGHHGPGKR